MVFSTYLFLFLFLPPVLLGYYALHGLGWVRLRTWWLIAASYVFYGWERPDFLILIFGSTCLDYTCGRIVSHNDSRHKKLALTLSVVGNLGLLAYFKYFNLAADSLNSMLDWLGMSPLAHEAVILPIGISFYTFQTMSYTIDIYRGEARRARNFADLACYVALFPQLVAGPIVRYSQIAEQLRERVHSLSLFGQGALLFMCGFAKKILLADSAARIADVGFSQGQPGVATAWLALLAYSMQIYFDFSGYSDMAIGLGRMFGFEFPLNFASPYHSRSITEFWRRWHISLSTWLRDYLYIPLGGNRKGPWRTYANLATTMLLGGLWHGAQWTFVVWGALHGGLLALERFMGKRSPYAFLPSSLQVVLTFLLTMLAWVFFRATSFTHAYYHLAGMAGLNGWGRGLQQILNLDLSFLLLTGVALVLTWAGIQSDRLCAAQGALWMPLVHLFLGVCFVIAVGHMFFQEYSPFLYFQF